MKKIISCMIAVVMLLSLNTGTFASEAEIITFDQISGTLTVADSNLEGVSSGDIVTMIVLKPGYTFEDLEKGTKTLAEAAMAIKQTEITKSGTKYGYTFGNWTLPDTTKIGNYTLRVGMGKSYVVDGSFYFITVDLLRKEVNEFDKATASQVAGELKDKEELFSLDLTEYNSLDVKDSVNAKLAAEDFSVADDATSEMINTQVEKIKTKLYEFVAVASLNEAETEEEVEALLGKYEALYGVDLTEESAYGKLSDASKKKVKKKMAEAAFEELSDIKKAFDEYCVLVRFENGSYGDVATLIEENNDILGFDLTDYNKLSSTEKTYVHKKMVEDSPVYSSSLDAKKAFDEAVAKAPGNSGNSGETSRPSGSSGGSGGSSSKGGGSKVVGLPVATAVPTEEPAEEVPDEKYFNDLSNVLWAEESINALYKEGVVSGRSEGIFAPNDNVTRAEFIKMLTEALLEVDENAVSSFKDVDSSDWYYKYAATCQKAGLVLGYEDGTLKPDSYISRQEMAVMVKRFLNHNGVSLKSGDAVVFADSETISEYAKVAAGELYASGIMTGDENRNFMGMNNTTRAQAAKVIYAAMKLCK